MAKIASLSTVTLLAVLLATPVQAAPRAPSPAAVHAAALPFDAHTDIAESFDAAQGGSEGQFTLALAAKGGLRGAAVAVFAPQEGDGADFVAKARALADKKDAAIHDLARLHPKQVGLALSPADFRRITASGRLAVVESVVNGGAFVTSPEDIDLWAKRGVRIFGFVHAGHNALADSSRPAAARGEGVSRNGGLSPLGKAVLARLNRDGVLVDVSQLSDPALEDVLKLSRAPVIATHSNLRALVDNTRNLTDAQVKAIAAKGGVVGVNAFSAYLRPRDPAFTAKLDALKRDYGIDGPNGAALSPEKAKEYDRVYHELRATEPRASVEDLAKAVDHVVKLAGIDHVALSTDFNHGGGVVGWENEGDSQAVTEALLRHGYTPAQIAKIWSGNVLRVWTAAQARAAGKR